MTDILLYPSESTDWCVRVTTGSDSVLYTKDSIDHPLDTVLTDDGSKLNLTLSDVTTSTTVELFASIPDGLSVADCTQVAYNVKVSRLPDTFEHCGVYMRDADNEDVVYPIDNASMGRDIVTLRSSVKHNPEFNAAFVCEYGFVFSHPATPIPTFKAIVTLLDCDSRRRPTYCTAQDVLNFMQILDNDGKPFKIGYDTYPRTDVVEDLIVQSEAYIDSQTQDSWRENRAEHEMHNLATYGTGVMDPLIMSSMSTAYALLPSVFKGYEIPLRHQDVRELDEAKGDKIEVRRWGSLFDNINLYSDADPSERSVWGDYQRGIIFLKQLFIARLDSVRVTYRWGKTSIPDDIRMATIAYTAIQLVSTEWYRSAFPVSASFSPDKSDTITRWEKKVNDALAAHTSQITIGGI